MDKYYISYRESCAIFSKRLRIPLFNGWLLKLFKSLL